MNTTLEQAEVSARESVQPQQTLIGTKYKLTNLNITPWKMTAHKAIQMPTDMSSTTIA